MRRAVLLVLCTSLLNPSTALFARPFFRSRSLLATAATATPAKCARSLLVSAATATDQEAGKATIAEAEVREASSTSSSKATEPPRAGLSDWLTLWRLSKPDLPLILVAMGALLIAATGEVITPQLQSSALNIALQPGGVLLLGPSIMHLAVAGLFTAIGTGIRGFVFWILGSRLVSRLREALYASMLAKPQAFHDGRAPAELGSRLSSDVFRLGEVLSLNINIVLRQAVQTLGGIAFVYRLHASLAGVLALGVLARSTWSSFYGQLSRQLADGQQDALASTSAVALQGLTLVETVRAYGTQKVEGNRYAREVSHLLTLQNRQGGWYGVSRVVTGTLSAALICSTLALGASLVARGKLEVGALTSLVLYTGFVALGSATKVFELVDVSSESVEETDALQLAEHQKERTSPEADRDADAASTVDATADAGAAAAAGSLTLAPRARGELQFSRVCFRYPARESVTVLDGVSLAVRPGELVAVVGGSGSGKSTLLKLALRFYAPESGTVTLDGRPLESLEEDELRRLVTWLPQEPPLFPLTIGENIAYGAGAHVPIERIVAAAEAANCHGFIQALPLGYATPIGASGSSLSGGQRQRIAIARALLRDPAVLMLDEPTSALDPASAELVEEALRRASGTRSVVLITHKPAQAALCDRVVVLDHGRVAEEGTPAQLLALRGRYWEMVQPVEAAEREAEGSDT